MASVVKLMDCFTVDGKAGIRVLPGTVKNLGAKAIITAVLTEVTMSGVSVHDAIDEMLSRVTKEAVADSLTAHQSATALSPDNADATPGLLPTVVNCIYTSDAELKAGYDGLTDLANAHFDDVGTLIAAGEVLQPLPPGDQMLIEVRQSVSSTRLAAVGPHMTGAVARMVAPLDGGASATNVSVALAALRDRCVIQIARNSSRMMPLADRTLILYDLAEPDVDVTPPVLLWRQMLRLRRWWLSRWGQLSRERCVLCRQGVPHAAARA